MWVPGMTHVSAQHLQAITSINLDGDSYRRDFLGKISRWALASAPQNS